MTGDCSITLEQGCANLGFAVELPLCDILGSYKWLNLIAIFENVVNAAKAGSFGSSDSLRSIVGKLAESSSTASTLDGSYARTTQHFTRCVDSDSHGVAFNAQDGDRDVITNLNLLLNFACQYPHDALLCSRIRI